MGLSAAVVVGWRRSWMTCLQGSASMSLAITRKTSDDSAVVCARAREGSVLGWLSNSSIPYAVRLLPCTMMDGDQSQLIRDTMAIVPLLVLPIPEDLRQLAPEWNPLYKSSLSLSLFLILLPIFGLRWTMFVSIPAPHANRLKSFRFWFHAG